MIDWNSIRGFEWDEGNITKSIAKHSVTNQESEEVFFNIPLLVEIDTKHVHQEIRMYALGKTNEARLLFISFTLRNRLIRIISARNMSTKEKYQYEKV